MSVYFLPDAGFASTGYYWPWIFSHQAVRRRIIRSHQISKRQSWMFESLCHLDIQQAAFCLSTCQISERSENHIMTNMYSIIIPGIKNDVPKFAYLHFLDMIEINYFLIAKLMWYSVRGNLWLISLIGLSIPQNSFRLFPEKINVCEINNYEFMFVWTWS